MCWSKTSTTSIGWTGKAVDDDAADDPDDRDERKSPGCLPITISNATTPKLKTSHFSFTSIVHANSVHKICIKYRNKDHLVESGRF